MRLQVIYIEVLELNLRQEIFDCLVPTLMQMPRKADFIKNEGSCKWDAVGTCGAGHIYQSDLHTSHWPAELRRLALAWRNKSM